MHRAGLQQATTILCIIIAINYRPQGDVFSLLYATPPPVEVGQRPIGGGGGGGHWRGGVQGGAMGGGGGWEGRLGGGPGGAIWGGGSGGGGGGHHCSSFWTPTLTLTRASGES